MSACLAQPTTTGSLGMQIRPEAIPWSTPFQRAHIYIKKRKVKLQNSGKTGDTMKRKTVASQYVANIREAPRRRRKGSHWGAWQQRDNNNGRPARGTPRWRQKVW